MLRLRWRPRGGRMDDRLRLGLLLIQFACGIGQIVCCLLILKALNYGNGLNNGGKGLNDRQDKHNLG